MIDVKIFYDELLKNGLDFFCGVPDSLLKDFCAYITDHTAQNRHVITANEGNAIALAAGHYIATGNPAVVYMQNSGTGNSINPLLSLTDEEVYKIPLLLIIGWRGEPGQKDEPQHIKQGKVTDKLLTASGIEYTVLPQNNEEALFSLKNACKYIKEKKKPYAIIVRKNSFNAYTLKNKTQNDFKLSREEAIKITVDSIDSSAITVSTTGQISRELYEYREELEQTHNKDFLTVGSMGHASSIALGIALEKPERDIYCFDGDGAFIMHMGALPVISSFKLKNFKHIVFNNQSHCSVGAQPTCASIIDFKKLAQSCGYDNAFSVKTKNELISALKKIKKIKGTVLLEIKVNCGVRKNLGRPKEHPQENKESLMTFLNENITFCENGALSKLREVIKGKNYKKALIFTGKNSYKKIKNIVDQQIRGIKSQIYNDFSTNPKSAEIDKALKKIKNFDFIIAVGGGSVMDFAKLFRFCYDNKISSTEALKLQKPLKRTPLIAIPTTAGTGAEATKFSVVYVNGEKYSFEHQFILPDYAIVDGKLVKDNPKYLKACCAADALCQSIESYWAVNSTKDSKYYAKKSLELCRDYLEKYVNSNKEEYAQKMAQAAFLSGKAINISKTTAAHALSYKITTDYNLPHGHAVSLSIKNLMKTNEKSENVIDKRGVDYLKATIAEIKQILQINDIDKYFDKLFLNIGLEQSLPKLGINDITSIAKSVNVERLKNNPVELDTERLKNLLC